jgi:signal transduction histidine kinase
MTAAPPEVRSLLDLTPMPIMETVSTSLEATLLNRLPATFAGARQDGVQACKILIIDDEEPNVRLLECVLRRAGFNHVISTIDSREAAALFVECQPDIVLTDWLMPEFDGCAVIEQLGELIAIDDYLPIVVLTADITPQTKKRALAAGATDFLTKPLDQVEVLLRIRNLLKARLSHVIVQMQNATLEKSVRQRTTELEHALAELRDTQQQVIQQERLAALGTMAGGIAHDFNNALSVIMGFGKMLAHADEQGLTKQQSAMALTRILTAAGDAAAIVRRLRDFYRSEEETEQHRSPVDLNDLMAQAISLTQPRWQTDAIARGRTITVEAKAGATGCIAGDAAELREVLTNLIFNAVDALPQGGTITLSTRCDGEFVALSVSDDGTGMSEEVRRRCLEPFFTTKGKQGTGLGLSMVFGIIQRHAGVIDVKSELGAGTVFTLRFPAARAAIEALPDPLPWSKNPLRVLVVDDQPILCQLVCKYLQDDLHIVEVALSGGEALEKFRTSHFDLVITDHVMVGMPGEQLANKIKAINPEMPVIHLTGYASESTTEKQHAAASDFVVEKPLLRAALRQALAKIQRQAEPNPGWSRSLAPSVPGSADGQWGKSGRR